MTKGGGFFTYSVSIVRVSYKIAGFIFAQKISCKLPEPISPHSLNVTCNKGYVSYMASKADHVHLQKGFVDYCWHIL